MNLEKLKPYLSHPFAFLGVLILAPLPFVYFLVSFFLNMQTLDQVEEEIAYLQQKSLSSEIKKEKENSFVAQMERSDHFYLDKHLESLLFLESEVMKLQALTFTHPQNEQIKDRLHFLRDGGNRLLFAEEGIQNSDLFQEVEEKQQQSVEMNEEDLKKLFTLIEGVSIWPYAPKEARPQLIIKDFDLAKKSTGPQEKVYLVNMQLIKREKTK